MMELATTQILFVAGAGLLVVALATLAFVAFAQTAAPPSERGTRGYQRQKARDSALFTAMEPVLGFVAAWMAYLPVGDLRSEIDVLIQKAGDWLGLTPDEFMALSVISGAVGASVAWLLFASPVLIVLGAGMMALLPYALATGQGTQRSVMIARRLPNVIELIALCVSAGMDFPGAVREVVGNDPGEDDPLQQELRQFLRELGLGHSRKRALEAMAGRVDDEGIQDFCASVIQSEEKGNPLKEVLEAQARILNMRRSFRAEVLANQASVKMVIPLTLLMLTVMLLIGAPLLIKFQDGI